MPIGDVFVLMLIAMYVGWIAAAAIRSNRRQRTAELDRSQEGP